jgi:hypothetical protein
MSDYKTIGSSPDPVEGPRSSKIFHKTSTASTGVNAKLVYVFTTATTISSGQIPILGISSFGM